MKSNSTDKVSCPILRRKVDKSWCYGCSKPCDHYKKFPKDYETCSLGPLDLNKFLKNQDGLPPITEKDILNGYVPDVVPENEDPHGIKQHEMGAKLDAHKIKAGVLGDFGRALEAVAQVGTFGITKYARGSWQHVPDGVERYSDALWRHLLQENKEHIDADSGLPHEFHVAWNALARLELLLRECEVNGSLHTKTSPTTKE